MMTLAEFTSRENTSSPLIRARGLTVDYGADPVLINVDLEVSPGDLIGVVGPSGSGKSTLLRAMLGTIPFTSGSVYRKMGLTVSLVPQVEQIDWSFPVTVTECISMARSSGFRVPWIGRTERSEIDRVLERLGLSGLGNRHIRDLSGGQQRRVFLARALFTNAELVFLDDPTSGLDVRTRHDVLHLLSDLSQEGLAIVLTTHDINGIATHLPRILCLNGRVTAFGTPSEVLVPDVLEATYGSPMHVLEHSGMLIVLDPMDLTKSA